MFVVLAWLLVSSMATSQRRRHLSEPWSGVTGPSSGDARRASGEKLRNHLILKHVGGNLTAADFGKEAYWHTHSGGLGLDEFAVRPERADHHANDHIKLVLGLALYVSVCGTFGLQLDVL